MKHLKFILPAMLILSACGKASTESPGSQNVTYLDMEQVLDNENLKSDEEFVDLIESLKVVQLETTDSEESMIGEYMGTNFVDGDNIIVTCKFNSNYPVKIFDGNGKFKFAIRKGEGPDEYLPFSNISYDYDNHLIMTISQNHLRFFNLDGHVVKDTILPFDAIEIQRAGDYYVLRHSGFSEEEYLRNNIEFLPSDFKKKNGYKRSIELSAEYDLYRQNYCGCVFSKREAADRENGQKSEK